jgi:hypothetical protein
LQQRLVLLHPNQVCLLWSQNRWQARLHVVGLDLRDVASVEAFCQFMAATFESGVDIVVNNACQTVRRCRRVRTRLEKDTLLLPAEMDLKKETLLLPAEMDWRAAVPARAGCGVHPLSYSGAKAANRNMWDSGWEMSSRAVTPRPPISRDAMAPRTEGFTYDVGVWDSSIVQGPFSVAPCQTLRYQYLPAVDTTTPGYDDVAMINTVTQTSLLPLVKMVSF